MPLAFPRTSSGVLPTTDQISITDGNASWRVRLEFFYGLPYNLAWLLNFGLPYFWLRLSSARPLHRRPIWICTAVGALCLIYFQRHASEFRPLIGPYLWFASFVMTTFANEVQLFARKKAGAPQNG